MATPKNVAAKRSVVTPGRVATASRAPLYSVKFYMGEYIDRRGWGPG